MEYAVIRFIVAQHEGADDDNRIGGRPTLNIHFTQVNTRKIVIHSAAVIKASPVGQKMCPDYTYVNVTC